MTTEEVMSVVYRDGRLTVSLTGEVDHHSAKPLREQLDHQLYLHRPRELVLALEGVSFMDSSGLGLILGRLAVCRHFACPMYLIGADERMLRIFRMAGLSRIEGLSIEGLARDGGNRK